MGQNRRRALTFEKLESLQMLANGTATVEITSAPSTVEPNQRVDIEVRYRLTGNSRSGPWKVKELALYDEDLAFDDRIASTTGSISKQGTWQTHTFRNVDLSDFNDGNNGIELYARVEIDDNQGNFMDATDNSPVKRVTVGRPDVRVRSLVLSDAEVDPGDEIEIDAVIRNSGTADAGRSKVRYYFGPSPGSRNTLIGDGFVPNIGVLSPGEESSDSPTGFPQPNFTIPRVAAGTYYITAVADIDGDVRESNESNNALSVEIVIGEPESEQEVQVRLTCQLPTGPGVTIITHGFAGGSGKGSTTPDWTIEMAEAVLERSGQQGSVFVHDPQNARWVTLESRGLPTEDWRGRVARSNSNRADEEIVLVYDWTHESDDSENGWMEAAADGLFASLLSPLAQISGVTNLLTRPLHFIGHSRGTVVNSLAANRLGWHFPGLKINQFTTLDPHPSVIHGDPGALSRLLEIPNNILWADNYYRQDGTYEADLDFNGVDVLGSRNLELDEAVLGENAGFLMEHSDVHLWYLATIKPESPFAEDEPVDNPAFEDWWTRGTAYDAEIESLSGRANVGYARSRLGGGLLRIDQMNSSLLRTPSQSQTVFNGDFERGDVVFNEIPGWERHGGGGKGNLNSRSSDSNYLQLSTFGSSRRHNDMYIAPSVTHVEFDYWINNNDGLNTNDVLEVLIGRDVVDSISLGSETNGFVRNHRVTLPEQFAGAVTTLEFRIGGSGGIDSEVRIDNVGLVGVERGPNELEWLDLVHAAVVEQSDDPLFDFTGDGQVTSGDADQYLASCLGSTRGDTNADGVLNFADFLILAENFGQEGAAWSAGDFDFDELVDFNDFLLLAMNYGSDFRSGPLPSV